MKTGGEDLPPASKIRTVANLLAAPPRDESAHAGGNQESCRGFWHVGGGELVRDDRQVIEVSRCTGAAIRVGMDAIGYEYGTVCARDAHSRLCEIGSTAA